MRIWVAEIAGMRASKLSLDKGNNFPSLAFQPMEGGVLRAKTTHWRSLGSMSLFVWITVIWIKAMEEKKWGVNIQAPA